MTGRTVSEKTGVFRVGGGSAVPEFRMKDRRKRAMTREPRFLGMAVTLLRERCGKGKGRVAREAGVRRSHLLSYERGEAVPRPETLARLAEALGATVERIESMADALAAAPGLLEPAAPSDLETALLPPLPAAPRQEESADSAAVAGTLWLRLRPYTAVQRRAIVLETPDFHLRALSERLRQEAALDAAAARDLTELSTLVASLAPRPDSGWAEVERWLWVEM